MPFINKLSPDENDKQKRVRERLLSQDASGKLNYPIYKQPEDVSSIASTLGMGVEIAGGLAGGAVGMALVPFTGGVSVPVLAAAGGATGNWIKQRFVEDRDVISTGEMAASALYSLTPAANAAKAAIAAGGVLRAGAIRAGQGAFSAVGAEVAKAAIDKGELPNAEDLGSALAVGSVFGGALGIIEKRYQMDGALIKNALLANSMRGAAGLGASALAYNAAVDNGRANPISDAVMAGTAAFAATYAPAAIFGSDKNKLALNIGGSSLVMPKGNSAIHKQYADHKAAIEFEASVLGDRLNKEIVKSGVLQSDVLAAMDKSQTAKKLPQEVQDLVSAFHRLNDKNGTEILRIYGKDIPKDIEDAIKNNINNNNSSYVRGLYAAHDPRAVFRVDYATEASEAAYRAELIAGGNTNEEASAQMSRMLKDDSLFFTGTAGAATNPSSALKGTHNLSDKAKAYLGEQKDAGIKLKQTLSIQGDLIIQHERDKSIKDMLLSGPNPIGKLTNETVNGVRYVALNDGSGTMLHRQLDGVYVPDFVKSALKEDLSPNLLGDNTALKWYAKVSGLSKAAKTVGNLLESIAPQSIGNILIAASSGKLNPAQIKEGFIKSLYASGTAGGNSTVPDLITRTAELKKLMSLGVLRGGADVAEIKTLMGAASYGDENLFNKVLNKASSLYGIPDSAVRYSIFKSEVDELMRIRKPLFQSGGMDAIEKEAARLTNNHFPTYELIPKRLRQLSAVGALNSFGAFEFEMARNTKNMVAYGSSLIKEGMETGNRDMMIAGTKRLISFAAVAGTTAGVASLGNKMVFGTDEADIKAIENVALPSYAKDTKNSIRIKSDGTFSFAPLNYLMPHANMLGIITDGIAQAGGRNVSALASAKSTYAGNDVGPLLTPTVEALTNIYYGTKESITKPRDNAELFARLVQKAFVPQVIFGTAERFRRAVLGEKTTLGGSPNVEDSALRLAGVRQTTQSILDSSVTRIRSTADALNGLPEGYRQILKNQSNKKPENQADENAIYNSRAATYSDVQSNLREMYLSLSHLSKKGGFDQDAIIKAFKSAGLSDEIVSGVVFDYKVPMHRGYDTSVSDKVDNIFRSVQKDKRSLSQAITIEANGDPFKIKSLSQAYVDRLVSEARGNTGPIKLLHNLPVDGGQRARAIVSAMDTIKDEDATARASKQKSFKSDLIKSGAINAQVFMQMDQIYSIRSKKRSLN